MDGGPTRRRSPYRGGTLALSPRMRRLLRIANRRRRHPFARAATELALAESYGFGDSPLPPPRMWATRESVAALLAFWHDVAALAPF